MIQEIVVKKIKWRETDLGLNVPAQADGYSTALASWVCSQDTRLRAHVFLPERDDAQEMFSQSELEWEDLAHETRVLLESSCCGTC